LSLDHLGHKNHRGARGKVSSRVANQKQRNKNKGVGCSLELSVISGDCYREQILNILCGALTPFYPVSVSCPAVCLCRRFDVFISARCSTYITRMIFTITIPERGTKGPQGGRNLSHAKAMACHHFLQPHKW